MNKANYTGQPLQQFPISTEGLDFIQQQILLAAEYAQSAGGNYILSGCTDSGAGVSDGILVLNGEIIRFSGGPKGTNVRIVTGTESITANGQTYENARIIRHAEFGENVGGTDTFAWGTITPFPTNRHIAENYVPKTRRIAGLSLSQDIVNLPYVPDAAGWTQASVTAGQGHGWLRGRVNNLNELELKGSIVSDNNPASAAMVIPSTTIGSATHATARVIPISSGSVTVITLDITSEAVPPAGCRVKITGFAIAAQTDIDLTIPGLIQRI
jgi:hypothetical protein